MRKLVVFFLALFLVSPAYAHQRHIKHHAKVAVPQIIVCNQQGCSDRVVPFAGSVNETRYVSYQSGTVVPNVEGCPRIAFCGCSVSVRVFGHPVRSLYPARAYGKFPSGAIAAGNVAYRAHHVFYIESVVDGSTVMAYDPNSGGHLTRIHLVSLHGYRIVNPHG
jgi:hypothetical protein